MHVFLFINLISIHSLLKYKKIVHIVCKIILDISINEYDNLCFYFLSISIVVREIHVKRECLSLNSTSVYIMHYPLLGELNSREQQIIENMYKITVYQQYIPIKFIKFSMS